MIKDVEVVEMAKDASLHNFTAVRFKQYTWNFLFLNILKAQPEYLPTFINAWNCGLYYLCKFFLWLRILPDLFCYLQEEPKSSYSTEALFLLYWKCTQA